MYLDSTRLSLQEDQRWTLVNIHICKVFSQTSCYVFITIILGGRSDKYDYCFPFLEEEIRLSLGAVVTYYPKSLREMW